MLLNVAREGVAKAICECQVHGASIGKDGRV